MLPAEQQRGFNRVSPANIDFTLRAPHDPDYYGYDAWRRRTLNNRLDAKSLCNVRRSAAFAELLIFGQPGPLARGHALFGYVAKCHRMNGCSRSRL
jgi:hypothetical protein